MNSQKVINASITDIIFENRNKEYGAYAIRKSYNKRMIVSFLTITVAMAIFMVFAMNQQATGPIVDSFDGKWIMTEIPPTPETPKEEFVPPVVEDEPAAEPEPENNELKNEFTDPNEPEDTGMDTQELNTPTPDPDANPDATTVENKDLEGKNPDTETNTGNSGTTIGAKPGDNEGPGNTGAPIVKDEPSDIEFFAGKMPEAMNLNDIKRNIQYPGTLREVGMEGKVIVRVLVGPDGKYIKHVVKRSDHPEFTRACEKELKKLTFTPGEENGRKVKVWVTIPFKFKLSR